MGVAQWQWLYVRQYEKWNNTFSLPVQLTSFIVGCLSNPPIPTKHPKEIEEVLE